MILVIDIGNSRVHFACFAHQGRIVASESMAHQALKELVSKDTCQLKNHCVAKPMSAVKLVVYSSTCSAMEPVVRRFIRKLFGINALKVGKDIKVPITNRVDQPGQVGQDRLLNALAAYRRTHRTSIVIDLGTAITVDLVSGKGEFMGGAIAPGLSTMAKALHQNCSLLPLIRPVKPKSVVGKNTQSAIASGVYYGTIGIVNNIVSEMVAKLKSRPAIIVTGGDTALLKPGLTFKHLIIPNLTLEGLFQTAQKHLEV